MPLHPCCAFKLAAVDFSPVQRRRRRYPVSLFVLRLDHALLGLSWPGHAHLVHHTRGWRWTNSPWTQRLNLPVYWERDLASVHPAATTHVLAAKIVLAFQLSHSLIVTHTPRHNYTASGGMTYYQAAHDATDSASAVGNGETNSIFTSFSPLAAAGAGAGVSDFDDHPTIVHQNEDASSRRRRWWVHMAVGMVMVSCLVLITEVAMSNTRSTSLRGGTPGPASVAAATMAVEGCVLPSCLEGVCFGCDGLVGFVVVTSRTCGRVPHRHSLTTHPIRPHLPAYHHRQQQRQMTSTMDRKTAAHLIGQGCVMGIVHVLSGKCITCVRTVGGWGGRGSWSRSSSTGGSSGNSSSRSSRMMSTSWSSKRAFQLKTSTHVLWHLFPTSSRLTHHSPPAYTLPSFSHFQARTTFPPWQLSQRRFRPTELFLPASGGA